MTDMNSIFGSDLVITATPAPVVVVKQKQVIKNVSKLSDEALIHKLREKLVDVPEGSTRADLLILAKQHELWNYKGNIVAKDFKRKYAANGGNCGDGVASAFGSTEATSENNEKMRNVAIANDIDYSRWDHCNFGQRRMNLSNVLRGKIKRGEYVIICNSITGENTEWNVGGDEAEVG